MSAPTASREIRHKALRQALRVAFPACRFSVTGSRGTGYGWSRIGWTDGPTEAAVNAIAWRFFGSSFNGMTDGYDSTGCLFVWEGTLYHAGGSGFNTHRKISAPFARRLLAQVADYYHIAPDARPIIADRIEWDDGAGWSVVWPDGRDAGRAPIYPGADYRREWYACIYEASHDRTRYQRDEVAA